MKLSENKSTLPGRKQIYRYKDEEGFFAYDIIALEEEPLTGEPLLVKTMEKGKLISELPSIEVIRNYAKKSLKKIPNKYQVLSNAPEYPVKLSQKLTDLTARLTIELRNRN
jgi:nicotinate phosphoribosyltransferase